MEQKLKDLICHYCKKEFSSDEHCAYVECPECKKNYPDEEFIYSLEYKEEV